MRISYQFGEDDFLNFQSYARRWELLMWLFIEGFFLFSAIIIGIFVTWVSDDVSWGMLFLTMIFLSLNLVMFFLLWLSIVWRLNSARKNQLFGQVELTVSDEGLTLARENTVDSVEEKKTYFQPWTGVKRLKESRDYFFLTLGVGKEIVVPKRAFLSTDELSQFRDHVKQWIHDHEEDLTQQ